MTTSPDTRAEALDALEVLHTFAHRFIGGEPSATHNDEMDAHMRTIRQALQPGEQQPVAIPTGWAPKGDRHWDDDFKPVFKNSREMAVGMVDGIRGYTMEFSCAPDQHAADYDTWEEIICETVASLFASPPKVGAQWQDIASAPKDGTYIQVCRKDESFGWITGVAIWVDSHGISGWIAKGTGFFGELGLAEPELWQALAMPPKMRDL